MNKPNAFIVVSRYKENLDWLPQLTDDYIVYNKGEEVLNIKQKIVPNFGANQYDIFSYIYENYDNLPDLIAFMQGDPYDHCLPDRFNSLIYNKEYTLLFGDKNYPDGNYWEHNNSWYISSHCNTHGITCKFSSFDQYAQYIFENYEHEPTLTFPPGSQIIVEKERCLFYSKKFWKTLIDIIPTDTNINGGAEAHIIERSIKLIFDNKFKERI
jgi:hypothetical protein